jgi:predicted DNA binding CopG/RHH family protein
MNSKKVTIGAKPTAAQPANPDQWVKERAAPERETTKRLTIDIPESLHRAIKSQCAARGTKIADEVRELLLQKYANQ